MNKTVQRRVVSIVEKVVEEVAAHLDSKNQPKPNPPRPGEPKIRPQDTHGSTWEDLLDKYLGPRR